MLWQILLEHFYGWFTVYLVDDVAFRAGHLALATYRDHGMAYSPTRLHLTREQRVGDPTGDDFAVTILMGRLPVSEFAAGSPTPHWKEPLAREIPLQARKEVIEVVPCIPEVNTPIREDEQSNGLSRQVG